jgi:hypothetical protein
MATQTNTQNTFHADLGRRYGDTLEFTRHWQIEIHAIDTTGQNSVAYAKQLALQNGWTAAVYCRRKNPKDGVIGNIYLKAKNKTPDAVRAILQPRHNPNCGAKSTHHQTKTYISPFNELV